MDRTDPFAPRGRIERSVLEAFIAAGASTRGIAEGLDRSQSTVRHWLKRYGLETKRASRRPPPRPGANGICQVHGETEFRRRADGRWRCLKCRSGHVSESRRRIKRALIEEFGGACRICGYNRFAGALQFHHRNPEEKSFHIALNGASRSLDRAREEARKCVLLCANCHAEVEWGDATLPPVSA